MEKENFKEQQYKIMRSFINMFIMLANIALLIYIINWLITIAIFLNLEGK